MKNMRQVRRNPYKPDNIIVMSQEKALTMFTDIVHNTDAGYEKHNLFWCSVVEIVASLVASVTIDPF